MRILFISIDRLEFWAPPWFNGSFCGIFRNKDGIKPGRWGFWIAGLEIGSRNSGNWFGVLLKRIGLWPW